MDRQKEANYSLFSTALRMLLKMMFSQDVTSAIYCHMQHTSPLDYDTVKSGEYHRFGRK
jgi:hypothetical protein